eukprot:NODE_5304_length_717_cov_5.321856_g4461_i0.p1 GENE.NODE_5304_length_717_cov_5.321856_g4461_i0~~NODE_5304_length_717_cov_5.321856_g4461_i0.p1  ORF type:complete len:158 (-),score=46.89 NODE_5304_length_717_cov_5.321856_g4461_i0:90-563(-)
MNINIRLVVAWLLRVFGIVGCVATAAVLGFEMAPQCPPKPDMLLLCLQNPGDDTKPTDPKIFRLFPLYTFIIIFCILLVLAEAQVFLLVKFFRKFFLFLATHYGRAMFYIFIGTLTLNDKVINIILGAWNIAVGVCNIVAMCKWGKPKSGPVATPQE